MTVETTVFTFKLSNTFEEWVKMFDSPEIDAFHKTVGLTPIYRGKSLIDPKEVIVIHQAEEGVAKHVFSDHIHSHLLENQLEQKKEITIILQEK